MVENREQQKTRYQGVVHVMWGNLHRSFGSPGSGLCVFKTRLQSLTCNYMIKKILYGIGGFIVLTFILALIVPTPDQPEGSHQEEEVVVTEEVETIQETVATQEEPKQEEVVSSNCIAVSEQTVLRLQDGLNTSGVTLRG